MFLLLILLNLKDILAIYFERFRPDFDRIYTHKVMVFDAIRVAKNTLDIQARRSGVVHFSMSYWKVMSCSRGHQQDLKCTLEDLMKYRHPSDPLIAKIRVLIRKFYEVETYCWDRAYAIS